MNDLSTKQLSPRAERKQKQIRDAACRLFLENGYANTSTDAIVKASGVSKQTLYAYYPGKERLLIDVMSHLVQFIPDGSIDVSVEAPTDLPALRRALLKLANQFLAGTMQSDYQSLIRLLIAESPQFPRLAALFSEMLPQKAMQRIKSLLSEAERLNTIEPVDTEAAARLFFGSLLTFTVMDGLCIAPEVPRLPDSVQVERLIDLYMRMFDRRES